MTPAPTGLSTFIQLIIPREGLIHYFPSTPGVGICDFSNGTSKIASSVTCDAWSVFARSLYKYGMRLPTREHQRSETRAKVPHGLRHQDNLQIELRYATCRRLTRLPNKVKHRNAQITPQFKCDFKRNSTFVHGRPIKAVWRRHSKQEVCSSKFSYLVGGESAPAHAPSTVG